MVPLPEKSVEATNPKSINAIFGVSALVFGVSALVAHTRQSRPDSGLDFYVKLLKKIKLFTLRSEAARS